MQLFILFLHCIRNVTCCLEFLWHWPPPVMDRHPELSQSRVICYEAPSDLCENSYQLLWMLSPQVWVHPRGPLKVQHPSHPKAASPSCPHNSQSHEPEEVPSPGLLLAYLRWRLSREAIAKFISAVHCCLCSSGIFQKTGWKLLRRVLWV